MSELHAGERERERERMKMTPVWEKRGGKEGGEEDFGFQMETHRG